MDLIELTKIIRQREGEKLEFKRNMDSAVGKTICAFLNTDGGQVVVGIDAEGQIVGCEKDAIDRLSNLLSAITPRAKVETEQFDIEGRKIIVITVQKSDKLHTFGNIGYVRIGSTTRELQLDEIIEKAAESMLLSFDEAFCIDAKETDLSSKILQSYLEKRKKMRNVSPPKVGIKKIWELVKAVVNGRVTNAGILFFSDHPQQFHPNAELRYIEFASEDMKEIVEERVFSGNIWKISDDVSSFLEKRIARESTIRGFEKIVAPHFPLEALREAVNNALIHRNYFDRGDIRIFLFPDRIEIVNPGSFPPGVTPQMPVHRPRNPLLSQYFYDIGKIEKYGSGLIRMYQLCKEGGYPEPEFVLTGGQTKVIFYFLPIRIREVMKEADEIDKQILSKIYERKSVRSGELLATIPLSKPSLVARLNRLVLKKLITKKGKGRSTVYTITL